MRRTTLGRGALSAIAVLLALPAGAMAQDAPALEQLVSEVNVTWVLVGTALDLALQIAGALSAPTAALLLVLQGSRGLNIKFRNLSGYSVHFARFAISAGAVIVAAWLVESAERRLTGTFDANNLRTAVQTDQFETRMRRQDGSLIDVRRSRRQPEVVVRVRVRD